MEPFRFELVTPEASYFSGDASLVEAPGKLGDFGVLAGHMNFISTLRAGIISVHDMNNHISRIFVSGGIAEVNPVSCTILAEQIIDLDKISRSDAEARLAEAKQQLDNVFEEEEILLATKNIELAEAVLAAVSQ